mgnify:CR=1 FL=1|jgi:hypothetical protein
MLITVSRPIALNVKVLKGIINPEKYNINGLISG